MTPTTYRPPTLTRGPQEDQHTYGLRALRLILEIRAIPATLTDRDLELADDAARDYATQAHGGPDRKASALEPHQLQILATFSEARHWIARSQARRRQWAQDDATRAQETTPPTAGTRPGQLAPLVPQPPGKGPGSHADSRPDFLTTLREEVQRRTADDGVRF